MDQEDKAYHHKKRSSQAEIKMRPLRIGINALFRGKPTGVANYIINLVKYLSQLDKHNEYYVFLTKSNQSYFDLAQDNLHGVLCSVNTGNPLLRRTWEQTIFPSLVHGKKLDILHCPVNIIPLFARCRSIVTFLDCQYFHASPKNTFLRKYFHNIFMRLSIKKADAIITISNSMKNELLHYLSNSNNNIYVTPLGQDYSHKINETVDLKKIKRHFGITRKYLLFVGFPQYRKNLPGLLKGFAMALKKIRNPYDLVICGDIETKIESDYPNVLRTIEELKIGNYVKFTNYLENPVLQNLMSGAELFVFPSFYEGFGLPVIEAMACGLPVLVSDIPVMHEIVGEAGEYINPYNVESISRGICTLLSDQTLREKLRMEGKTMASRFTWENTAIKTLECYQKIGKEGTS